MKRRWFQVECPVCKQSRSILERQNPHNPWRGSGATICCHVMLTIATKTHEGARRVHRVSCEPIDIEYVKKVLSTFPLFG